MKEITFIIPCAGKATRLGIPFCKEMFPIDKEITLIDVVFNNLRQFKDKCQIVVIISKDKENLVKYLSKYADEFDIYFVYQKSYFKELIGAIRSAEEFFSKKNILILPDIITYDKEINNKLKQYVDILDEYPYTFLICNEHDKNVLSRVGNVKINHKLNVITDVIDKPTIEYIEKNNLSDYWISIGFRGDDSYIPYYKYFEALLSKKKMSEIGIQVANPYVKIDFALDLGVWDNIQKFYSKLNNGGVKNED